MNSALPHVPDGYRPVRPLSVRAGSWVQLATNPAAAWCCLKLQQVAHADSLAALTATRDQLQRLSLGEGLLPLLAWGVDPATGVLWEELPLADNLLADGRFLPEQSETYTPLNLVTWLAENGPASTAQVIAWGLRLANALACLHEAGLFHRDVKPANILLLHGQPVLADYGSVGREGSSIEFPGTEGYVPPDGLGSPALDVFALGRSLYELWTGLDRFHFPSLPPAVTHRPDWNTHGWLLNDLLLHAADGRPSHRYGTARQLHAALTKAAQGQRRISRRTFFGAATVTAGAVVAAYVWKNLPSHRAVWRRLPPARFGYENWQGNELTCDWKNRALYSINADTRGTFLQRFDLRTWKHSSQQFPEASKRIGHSVLTPAGDELWGVEHVTGEVVRIKTDGSSATPLPARPVNENDFTGALYWNPVTDRLGRFAGYGDFHAHNRRHEFDAAALQWKLVPPPAGPLPWPRGFPFLMIPGREWKRWFLFGGPGNSSGKQSDTEEGLNGYDGRFYPLDDFWELDLATNRWRPLLPVQRWQPVNLKSAVYHSGLDGVVFLTGSEPGRPKTAGLHLWAGEAGSVPRLLPSSGESIQMFQFWSLLVEPDTQDLWVFADEGVFAVSVRPA